ncbi:MAG: DegT/DnrJ/EryC1/StrS family aminotransferase [Candidatus Peribacter sp.]|jgi:perosamine synthetase|nr:DegT/DnrJ/EryC1/StrS family aminotransferase [Candidatus Peribacter sp.]MBT4393140.1 DegT/DnrJ/EryC1/StrS family aminotransferase [Candidatus Peribacter sp.]MBT4600516.1 DegT/DnrJ/EryC1/StrS family aminotransferase [Candidatus Peribacter sp.]MBT5148508.1 DegT/DnrJ/EryC1/StrS family aminotransferase [Candidatus Peribacter sp.]MBT5638675.1 DegT/DnrJ/EryC1/StrS family aminotransferase [Candidatus Peribacter sp.]
MKVPVNEPLITDAAKLYVADAMDTGWISSAGPCVEKFEEAFAKFIGVKHAIFTNSGTSALHTAARTLNIGPGDEVIIPNFTMIASPFSVMYTGATPVFVDIDPETLNIDAALIEAKITDRTKAIMPVHIYGLPCDMDPILEIAAKHNLAIIEDAAEVHGAEYKGKKCGSIGTINAFSFYGNKIITTGEGGMITTDDDALAKRARWLKDLAHSPTKRFRHEELGFNYRPTNLQAAVGLGQLEAIDDLLERKRSMAALYKEGLSGIEGLRLPQEKDYATHVYWMYAVMVESGRDELCARLKEKGVDTREFFLPCHSQPAIAVQTDDSFPVTEDASARGFYLPSGLAITDEQIAYVCETMRSVCN